MIKEAVLFGQIGAVVCRQDKTRLVFRLNTESSELVPSQIGVGLILDSGAEATALDGGPFSIEDVRAGLADVSHKHCALRAVLTGLDPELSETTRDLFICEADDLLTKPDLREFVRRRLLGCPFPDDAADLEGALRLASVGEKARALAIYQELQQSLKAIASVREYWVEAVGTLPLGIELDLLERSVIDRGLLAQLTIGLVQNDHTVLGQVMFKFSQDRCLNRIVPRFPHFLGRLVSCVRDHVAQEEEQEEQRIRQAPEIDIDPLEQRILAFRESFDTTVSRLSGRSRASEIVRRRGTRSAEDVLNNVQRSVDFIVDLMTKGRLNKAERALAELIEYQAETGAPDDLAKSLSALGAKANDLREFDLSLKLYRYANATGVDDPVLFNGPAETLRDLGRFGEALAAYDEARQRFPDNAFTYTGRAETLRDLGRFGEALAAYDEARQRFPNEAVAYNGRAETLRDLGRFEEALAAYDEARQHFPDNAVAYSGRAETLRDLGRFEEALAAYDEARQRFPDSAFTYTGRAETQRDLGRFQEALAAYDEARQRFPDSAFTYTGRAETLRDLGRFQEALAAYDAARQRFPDNAFTYTGRAETLRDLGRYRDAEDVYRETLNAFPANRVARNALACLLIENGDVDSGVALIAIDAQRCKQDWIDYHVLAMADVKRGKYREAGTRLEYGAANCPNIKQRSVFITTLAFVRVRQRQFETAIELVGQLNNNVLPFHRPFVKVLEAHAEAECGRLKGATSAIGEARALGTAQVVTLANHIAKRYRLGDLAPPTMNPSEVEQLDAEIAEQEFALALRAA